MAPKVEVDLASWARLHALPPRIIGEGTDDGVPVVWTQPLLVAPNEPTDQQVAEAVLALIAERDAALAAQREASEERDRLFLLLNTPELKDFSEAVVREAAHQRERWGTEHDAGKESTDWYWLLGFLAGKAVRAAHDGDIDKAKHHTISSAAALANWHAALSGEDTRMRPGIQPPEDFDPGPHVCPGCHAVGEAPHLSGCIDAAMEREQEEMFLNGPDSTNFDDQHDDEP